MINKEKLKKYANLLKFDMEDSEYETLEREFDVIESQMNLIGKIDGLSNVEPMTFPYLLNTNKPRRDEEDNTIERASVFKNTDSVLNEQVKVPKVVEWLKI